MKIMPWTDGYFYEPFISYTIVQMKMRQHVHGFLFREHFCNKSWSCLLSVGYSEKLTLILTPCLGASILHTDRICTYPINDKSIDWKCFDTCNNSYRLKDRNLNDWKNDNKFFHKYDLKSTSKNKTTNNWFDLIYNDLCSKMTIFCCSFK